MKKKLFSSIVVVLCLFITVLAGGCGKSESVLNMEEKISALGEISLDSEPSIKEAEDLYALLEPKEQQRVENYDVLTTARATYEELVASEIKAQNDALVAVVYDAIAAIGEVNVDSGDAIATAQAAYDSLPSELQPQVENYSVLTDAATQLVNAKAAAVDALIAAIGEVTLDSGKDISAAHAAYDALTEEEQAVVTGVATLTTADKTYSELRIADVESLIAAIGEVTLEDGPAIISARSAFYSLTKDEQAVVKDANLLSVAYAKYTQLQNEAKEAEKKELLRLFDVSEDSVQGITWYEPKAIPQYIDIRSYVIPYIGVYKNSKDYWICTRYNYTGDNWIFWENMTIVIDGVKYYESVSRNDLVRDNDTEVWEYYDKIGNADEITRLKAIANSTETIIRFQGDNYYYDLTVSTKDKETIKNVLALYELLKSE